MSSCKRTGVFDCIEDNSADETSVASIVKQVMENSHVLKVMIGCMNDVIRMRRDFATYPLVLVDVADMFAYWKSTKFEDCFAFCESHIVKRFRKSKKTVDEHGMKMWLEEYNNPGLEFLMNIFSVTDEKDKSCSTLDWRKRVGPDGRLPKRMLEYAAKDSYYTLLIFFKLFDKVCCPTLPHHDEDSLINLECFRWGRMDYDMLY